MSLGSRLIQTLQQLITSSTDYTSIRPLAREFFGSIYNIATSDYTFTQEEKSVVGNLVHSSLPNLQTYLSLRVDEYDSHSGLISRTDRSSLQFLLDDYKDFPISKGEKLGDYLNSLIDSEDLAQWDNFLRNYIDGEVDAIIDTSSDEFLNIPKSHWWWRR